MLGHHQTGGARLKASDATGILHPAEEGDPAGNHQVCTRIYRVGQIQEALVGIHDEASGRADPTLFAAFVPGL